MCARFGDVGNTLATHHKSARKKLGGNIGDKRRRFRKGLAFAQETFVDRSRFSRKRAFVDRKQIACHQKSVCADTIAFADEHHIARNDLAGWDLALGAVANDAGIRLRQITQRRQCALAARLLKDHQTNGAARRGNQECALAYVAYDQIKRSRAEHQCKHRLTQGLERDLADTAQARRRQFISAPA